MAKFAIDLTPLKKYPDFRNLWTAGLISYMGSMITYVAMPFQLKEITNSYLAVGLLGAVEIIPLILFGLYGGVLADSVDRKKMVWATEAGALILVSISRQLLVMGAEGLGYLFRRRTLCHGQWITATKYGFDSAKAGQP